MRIVKLKDVAKITTGKTPRTSDNGNFSGVIPFVKPPDLGSSIPVTTTSEYLSEQGANSISVIPKDSIMVCCIGSLGKVGIAGQDLATNQQINSLTFDPKLVDYKFGYYFSLTLKEKLDQMAHSAVVPIVNKTSFSNLDFVLIPIEEQKLIVRKLDVADALRQKRKQAMALLDNYLKAVFLEMFGDDLENGSDELRKYLRVVGGGAFKSTDFQEIGVPVIKIGTVNKGFFDLHNCSFLPLDFLKDKKNEKYIIFPGDLLISLTGTVGKEDYGNVCFATSEYSQYLLNQRVAKLDFDENMLTKEFLFFFFKAEKIKSQLTSISRGVRQANISNEDILSLKIALPPLAMQRKFSELAKKMTLVHLAMTVQAAQIQRNFDTLMQKAFN